MAESNDGRKYKSHKFRLPLDMWLTARKCVKLRDDPSVSWVLRDALTRYIADTVRRQRRGELPPFPDDDVQPEEGTA